MQRSFGNRQNASRILNSKSGQNYADFFQKYAGLEDCLASELDLCTSDVMLSSFVRFHADA